MKLNLQQTVEPKKQINFHLYESTYNELKDISNDTGISIQNLLRHAVNEALPELKK